MSMNVICLATAGLARLTWADICESFPDRWVVLADIGWVNETDFDFVTAAVVSHHERRRDASPDIKAARARNAEVGCFWTGRIQGPIPRISLSVVKATRFDRSSALITTKALPLKKTHGPKARSRGGPALPVDACPVCGTAMVEKRGTMRLPVNGEEIAVPSAAHLRCPKCGEVVLRFGDSKRLGEDAIAIYRKKHGLLSADEIRAIRETFDLTQAELARLLRLGANTVSRWESGRNVQTAAMDLLLRMIRDLPDSIAYLRSHAA